MTAPLTTSQLRAAWGPPCRFAAGTFTFWSGARVTVDRRILYAVDALDNVMHRWGYAPRKADTGAFVCRAITGGSGYSLHAYGIAVDINWSTNPYTTGLLITDMPAGMVNEITGLRTRSGAPVWGWGGNYRSIKDAMHFEIVCTPAHLASGIAATVTDTGGFGTMNDDQIRREFANQDKRLKAVIAAELAPIIAETQGLQRRTSLTRRIVRAIAAKVGVTQSEIDSQA